MTYAVMNRAAGRLAVLWLASTMFFWLFAFAHLPAASPEWLVRAQAACFGTTETGLPNSGGWVMLTVAPLSLLLALLVAFPTETRHGVRKLWRTPSSGRLLRLMLALFVAEAFWAGSRIITGVSVAQASFESERGGLAFPPGYTRGTDPAPRFTLTDQSGAEIGAHTYLGKTVIVTFAFAHCRTICPVITRTAINAARELGPEKAELLVITLDPWRDTVASLPDLARRWELPANAHVLSGEVNEVNAVHAAFGMPTLRDEKSGDITHPGLLYVINSRGELSYTLNNPPADWVRDAVTLAETSV